MLASRFNASLRIITALLAAHVQATRGVLFGSDGSCTLYGFVPFTSLEDYSCTWGCPNDGFMHMTSAVMAIDDFNNRDSPILEDLEEIVGADCPVYFNNLKFFDTGVEHEAITSLWESVKSGGNLTPPCMAVGPFTDLAAIELSSMAMTMRFPLIVNRAHDYQVIHPAFSPFTTQIYPPITETSGTAAATLRRIGRTDFIAVIYPLSPTGSQWRESLTFSLTAFDIQRVATVPYETVTVGIMPNDETMNQIKASGYRTIILTMQNPVKDFQPLAEAAGRANLTNGEYLWILIGSIDMSFLNRQGSEGQRLLEGSLWINPGENSLLSDGPFVKSFRRRDQSMIDRLNELNPIQNEHPLADFPEYGYATSATPGYAYAKPDFIEKSAGGGLGSGYMYDSIMSAGIGACAAWKSHNGSAPAVENGSVSIPVESVVKGIQSVRFRGTTGKVRFGGSWTVSRASRAANTSVFNVLNVLPQSARGTGFKDLPIRVVFHIDWSDGDDWFRMIETPYYADGRSVPPDLLRDTPEQNYLTPGLRIAAFIMCGTCMLLCVAAAIWIAMNRNHRVLRASQPFFLYCICVGAFIFSCSILTLSFDENTTDRENTLDLLCIILPLTLVVGHICTYGALSAKLWRINRVLQMTRRKIEIRTVLWPTAALMGAALVLLTIWTVVSPMRWVRITLDDETGESYGTCDSDTYAYFSILVILMIIPTCLTGYMAYKTKDIDSDYSESRWIFIMVLVQAEAILFYVPMVLVLQGMAPNVKYMGFVFVIWTLPMSTISLVMGPKVVSFWSRASLHRDHSTSPTSGGSGIVRASGFNSSGYCASVRSHASSNRPAQSSASLYAEETTDPTNDGQHGHMLALGKCSEIDPLEPSSYKNGSSNVE